MIYFNVLLLLRILNIVLVIWFLYEFCSSGGDTDEIKRDPEKLKNETDMKWSDIDLTSPPKLNDSLLEALRLNEFLSKPQYTCNNKRTVGGHSDSYILCYDSRFLVQEYTFGKTLIVTGLTNALGVFEGEHNTTRWEAFIPPDDPILDEFKVDVEVSYIPEVTEDGYFPMSAILNGINEEKYAVAKFEIYSEHFDDKQLAKAPSIVADIVDHLSAEQLLLDVRIENSTVAEIAPLWTKLLNSLFYKFNYRLIGSLSNGACIRPMSHCVYRASFVKADLQNATDAPVFGLGSPGEERVRLIQYLKKISFSRNCTKIGNENGQIPPICLDYEDFTECSYLYLRYRPLDTTIMAQLNDFTGTCDMKLHYPEPTSISAVDAIKIIKSGISADVDQVVPGFGSSSTWNLEPFENILRAFTTSSNRKKYLLVDLDGDEMHVLDAMVQDCLLLKQFRQISFTFNIFFGEENINYRKLYLSLLKLENCGFSKTYSKSHDISVVSINYKRDSGF